MKLHFYKYQGTGNDFVIIDNRKGDMKPLHHEQVKKICNRKFGIGADGLMIMNHLEGYDFEMLYFNADGFPGSMCGNGGRCMVKFAGDMGINAYTYRFMAVDGEHLAEIDEQGWIKLKMKEVNTVIYENGHAVLDTGSPHLVKRVHDIENVDVVETGRHIRNSKEFVEKGINVNFVEALDDDTIFVRTYERGVEDETLSCGTGVTAASLISAHHERGFNRIEVKTPGGRLSVEFEKMSDHQFQNIWLCGPATRAFNGEIDI